MTNRIAISELTEMAKRYHKYDTESIAIGRAIEALEDCPPKPELCEATEELKRIALDANHLDKKYVELAINALERQTPKKPVITKLFVLCPHCNDALFYAEDCQEQRLLRDTLYCDRCGQAIDWGDCEAENV